MDFNFLSIFNIPNLIFSTAVSTASVLVLLKIFGQGILEKLNRDWKEKQEIEISNLRSKLKVDEETFSNLLNIYKSSTDEIQKKRIAAATELWEITITVKNMESNIFFYGMLKDSEYDDFYKKEIFQKILKNLPTQEVFDNTYQTVIKRENYLRPFVTDAIWMTYHTYRSFIYRVHWSLYKALQEEKRVPNWKENSDTKKRLSCVIDENELNGIYNLPSGSFDIITSYLEEKLIIEMNKMFSGEFNIRNQKEIFDKIKESSNDMPGKISEVIDKPWFQLLKRNL